MFDAEVLDFVLPEVIRPWSYRCKMPIERITRNHKAQILSKRLHVSLSSARGKVQRGGVVPIVSERAGVLSFPAV